jgi:AraC-like DNA-binding protein
MSERGIAGAVVGPVLQALRELGLDLPLTAPADGMVPGVNADDMIDRAAAALRDPALGVSLARRIPLGALGPLDYGLITAASLREGLERTSRHYAVVTDRVKASVIEAPPRATVVLERAPGVRHSRHWIEFSIALIAARVRATAGPEFVAESVALQHGPPDGGQATHDEFFGVPVRFDAARDEISFAIEWLDRPLRTAVAALADVLELHLRALQAPAADPFLDRLREALGALLDQGDISLQRAAVQLAMSTRTLQRELQRRGTSHQEVLDGLRRDRALRLLEDPGNTVASVADALGFSEPSAFFRAFRRWTGTSPSAARARGVK